MTSRFLRTLLLLALPLTAGAQAAPPPAAPAPTPTPSLPCLIGSGAEDLPRPASVAQHPRPEQLVGAYACAENGFSVTLRLDADGNFHEEVASTEPPDPSREQISGRWRLDGPALRLFNAPGAEELVQDGLVVSATRGVLILGIGQGATWVRRPPRP